MEDNSEHAPETELKISSPEELFVKAFEHVQQDVYKIAVSKGWWVWQRNFGEAIALMHSELSEALEFKRVGDTASDKIPEFTGVEEEFADVIIRIMDISHGFNFRVAEAIVAKIAFNKTRPYKHGKKF